MSRVLRISPLVRLVLDLLLKKEELSVLLTVQLRTKIQTLIKE